MNASEFACLPPGMQVCLPPKLPARMPARSLQQHAACWYTACITGRLQAHLTIRKADALALQGGLLQLRLLGSLPPFKHLLWGCAHAAVPCAGAGALPAAAVVAVAVV